MSDESGIWDSFLDYQARMVDMIAASVRRAKKQGRAHPGINAKASARMFLASAYTIVQLRFSNDDRRVVKQFIDHMLHLALHDLPSET